MMSKLGYGVYSNDYHFVNMVKERGAKVVLLYDLALQLASPIRAVCPDVLIIGRKYFPSQTWNSNPYLAYQDGVRVAEELPASNFPEVDVWQSYCEAISGDDPLERWVGYDMFERGFCDRVHLLGKKAIVGNIATGNGSVEQMLEMMSSLDKADYFGVHAYTSKEVPGLIDEWYFNRYKGWVAAYEERGMRFPPIILTEIGSYWPWKHPENYPPGECVELDPRPIFKQALEEMNKDEKVFGGDIFCLGDSGGWTGFDADGEIDIMPKNEEENTMTWDRHEVFDKWFRSLADAGFNPNTAIGKFRNLHPELGVPIGGEFTELDWLYVVQFFTDGIVYSRKGDWHCSIAHIEDELPFV